MKHQVKTPIGWVACDYTGGDMLSDVRHAEKRNTYEEARADAEWGEFEGVRWVATDGYLYVDRPDEA
jgi:hypothetical protein